ncbi:MAG: hypothetical protein DRI90_12705, partial [Deltaproteobacteria bacterium]
ADERPVGDFVVTPQRTSILAHVGVGEAYGGDLRISLATAIVQRWIGRILWLGPAEPAAAAQWLTGGVARFVARELLQRYGLITLTEYGAEINRLLSLLAASPLASVPNADLVRRGDAQAAAVIVARGALYATVVDRQLRAREGGQGGLLSELRELVMKAVKVRAALPRSAWAAALDRRLGAPSTPLFDRWIAQGTERKLPPTILGRCFVAGQRRYPEYSPGFDLDKTIPGVTSGILGLAGGGPAARAGLLATDRLVRVRHRRGRPDVEVQLVVERAGRELTIRYLPVGDTHTAQAFERVAGIPDTQCHR